VLGKDDALSNNFENLNNIAEQRDSSLQASSKRKDEDKAPEPERDESSMALEEYLASRLQQIGEASSEHKEIKGLRTGNGWDSNQVIEQVYKIEPISMKRAVEIALSSNRNLKERMARLLGRRRQEGNIIGTPAVEFVPIWKVKGFHECYYIRTNSYRVNVRSDVVGVEVEGKGRDLILERKHLRFVPSAIIDRFQMLGSFLGNESKYFVVSEVTELAATKSEAEIAISGAGRPLDADEEMMLTSWRTKRIFDTADLRGRGASVRVRDSTLSKESVLQKFREKVVRMPDRFKQILSSKLEITELKLIYVPFVRVPVQKGLVPRDVIINASSGELAGKDLQELLG